MDEVEAGSAPEVAATSEDAGKISRRAFIARGGAATAGLGMAGFIGALFAEKDKPVSRKQALPDAKYGRSFYGRGADGDDQFGQEPSSSDGR